MEEEAPSRGRAGMPAAFLGWNSLWRTRPVILLVVALAAAALKLFLPAVLFFLLGILGSGFLASFLLSHHKALLRL